MIILDVAGKFGRQTHRSRTDARRIGGAFPIVVEEDEPTRPTGEVKAIVELNPQRVSPEYRSSVDGFASSDKARARGSD